MIVKRLYSTSSKKWMSRQAKDPYCKLAKANQYRARSAFKLIQINEKYRLIHRNDVVVDCGAAPGGWTQVASEKVSKKGLVIGIDLLPIDPIPNAHLIKGNFMRIKTKNAIRDVLDGRSVDLVCSDMAPSFSGNHTADHARSMELCESALTFAEKVLQPGGSFVAKFLMGGTEFEFRRKLQTVFAKVKTEKPDASRKQSTEGFFVAVGYKPLKKEIIVDDKATAVNKEEVKEEAVEEAVKDTNADKIDLSSSSSVFDILYSFIKSVAMNATPEAIATMNIHKR